MEGFHTLVQGQHVMSQGRQLLGLGHNAMFKNSHIGIWSLVLLTALLIKYFYARATRNVMG